MDCGAFASACASPERAIWGGGVKLARPGHSSTVLGSIAGYSWSMRGVVAVAMVVLIAGVAHAQFRRAGTVGLRKNISYDGRFTFVRLNYTTAPGGYFYRG